jgi:hypothetical protein
VVSACSKNFAGKQLADVIFRAFVNWSNGAH